MNSAANKLHSTFINNCAQWIIVIVGVGQCFSWKRSMVMVGPGHLPARLQPCFYLGKSRKRTTLFTLM